jgi:hypothetical protein
MACQSLHTGDSDLALAGGVNLILSPEVTVALSQAGMMASDGHCKSFDAAADGYVRGEGTGIVVLKRLSDALADRIGIRFLPSCALQPSIRMVAVMVSPLPQDLLNRRLFVGH